MALTSAGWVTELAERLGTRPPDESETNDLLALAGVSARASERTAAPISCWLAARASLSPKEALARARELAAAMEPGAGLAKSADAAEAGPGATAAPGGGA